MKHRLLSVVFISFLFSGCTAIMHWASTSIFEEEDYAQKGQYQKCVDYILGPKGIYISPENVERIISENLYRVKNFRSTNSELFTYLFDSIYLTKSLIEIGQFDEACHYIEIGLKNSKRISDTLANHYQAKYKTIYKIAVKTQMWLLLYKGYIAWFKTGNRKDADKHFLPVEEIFNITYKHKRDYNFKWKYDDRKSIGGNLGTASGELIGIPLAYTLDLFEDFLSNTDEHLGSSYCYDRASFYHKIYRDHQNALSYLDKMIEIGKDASVLAIDLKYAVYLESYKKKIIINMELGQLEEANKILRQYNSIAGNKIIEMGASVFSLSDIFAGYAGSLYATGGALYALSRDFEKSKEYFDKAYKLMKSIDENTEDQNNRYGLATYYVYRGAYYYGLQNQYEKAAEYVDKGLSFITPFYIFSIHNDLDIETAYALSGEIHLKIATDYKEKKDAESAKNHYRIAMERAQESERQAKKYHNKIGMGRALSLMGWVEHYQGNNKNARNFFNKALEKVKGISNTDNWNIYYGAGKTYEALGQTGSAIANYKKSVGEIEKLWTGRFKDTYKQLSFIEDRLAVFEPLIRLLVKKKDYAQAIGYMEQSKSRSFYESSPYYSGHNVQNADPKWQNVKPLTASQIKKMLPADTALLEYYVGKDTVVGGVITRKNVYFQKMGIQAKELEIQVNNFRTAIDKERTGYANVREVDECIDNICNTGNSLYKSLVKPFEKKLSGYKHICIIPHGILHYLPFQALAKNGKCLDKNRLANYRIVRDRGSNENTVSTSEVIQRNNSKNKIHKAEEGKSAFLIEDYTISYAPSATILNIVRENNTKKKSRLLAVGSPPEMKLENITLPKLAYANDEILGVADLFSDKAVFTEKKATETVVKENIANHDILLFSTHGKLNPQEPLNSFIAFKKDWSNDGCLTVKEIEGLKMKANLAVLSACESGLMGGLTEENYGDDLFGLQRGFMKSGTTSVLSTLWRADDRSSESLVVGFFDHFIKKGQDKATALRNAQLYMIKDEKLIHPYYWSHFVLSGDWN